MQHTIDPVYDQNSRILILGTFPSVKSREAGFFYHHPQNRFWKVIAGVFGQPVPDTIEEKKNLLLRNRIAVWDVIKSCEIEGSSDSSIRNVTPSDLNIIINQASIREIYGNGDKAYRLYMKYCYSDTKRVITKLPSTSPANASFSLERLLDSWKVIAENTEELVKTL